jgi:uncharacterized protein YggT (Ycf19 family)
VQYFLYIICRIVSILLDVLLWAMLLRVILGWFGADEEGGFPFLLACLTEPIIAPVRAILSMFGVGDNSPVDVGFFVTSLLLAMLSGFLPALTL